MTHNGIQFSTRDKDHDTYTTSCSVTYHGSWWYFGCYDANLNGRYYKEGERTVWGEGITWENWKGNNVSLKTVTMQMRPGEEFSLQRALL